MVDGVACELGVVPRQSLADVTHASHVVTCEFGHAPKNVDKPLPRAAHERSEWHLSRHQKICGIGEVSDLESARYAVWARDDGGTEGRYCAAKDWRSASTRFASFGETAFAC